MNVFTFRYIPIYSSMFSVYAVYEMRISKENYQKTVRGKYGLNFIPVFIVESHSSLESSIRLCFMDLFVSFFGKYVKYFDNTGTQLYVFYWW